MFRILYVHLPYLHCRDSLNLNWCGMNNALLFQTFKNCCKDKTKTDPLPVSNHVRPLEASCRQTIHFDVGGVTWWKLHLSEAFDWMRDALAINQDVKLLPDTFVPGVWHIEDVAWWLPAIRRIHGKMKSFSEKVSKRRSYRL